MKKQKRTLQTFTYIGLAAAATLLLSGCGSQYMVLDPAGPVGQKELNLIVMSVLLMLIVIIPVLGLLIYIVYRYRDKPDNKAPYDPKNEGSKILEIVWWGIPIIIIAILGTVTVQTTYSLTQPPTKVAPMTVEVTSLDWKWLFQYPNGHIATVNYAYVPIGVPIQFVLTANAPMNSFWIPRLGGQEYTMPGMAETLWLQANQAGVYYGHGANFTGRGFTHTTFYVTAVPMKQYNLWVQHIKKTAPVMSTVEYRQLSVPSVIGNLSFSSYPSGSFEKTILQDGGKYMAATMQHIGKLQKMPKGMHMNN